MLAGTEILQGLGNIQYIDASNEQCLSWPGVVEAIRDGHALPKANVGDVFIPMAEGELLTRSASIAGLGAGTKTVSVRPSNPSKDPQLPTIQGVFFLFDEAGGRPVAIIDGALLTKWKTVADSLLGAKLLAIPEPSVLAIIGTGAIAAALAVGYRAVFPSLREVRICGRRRGAAEALAESVGTCAQAFPIDAEALRGADVVACATSSKEPVLPGGRVQAGTHVDLIGAHSSTMREADDDLLKKARLFVDCRETTIDHIGEIVIPMRAGVISPDSVLGDLYDLVWGDGFAREPDDITVFKNGGGAHLDLMVAHYLLDRSNSV